MSYTARAIEVLSGLEPVQKRPGMYTDTSCPNHLAQEVIDNSVDEALSGHAQSIEVTLDKDQTLTVSDDGRGMPVDTHPEYGLSGVELILCKLHAGGKFSDKNYTFSGGLHGVGVSVVNALSAHLEVEIRRDGGVHHIAFADGKNTSPLRQIDTCARKIHGTKLCFRPDPRYFEDGHFSVPRLIHALRAKAVLCKGLKITFIDHPNAQMQHWCYQHGMQDYLAQQLQGLVLLPDTPLCGQHESDKERIYWALQWEEGSETHVSESYANLIPTPLGGTHLNAFRQGLLEGIREYCEYHSLLPRGLKLSAEDVWAGCNHVLSVQVQNPQFSGQTKERLIGHQRVGSIQPLVKDYGSLWCSQHHSQARILVERFVHLAQQRLRARAQVARKRILSGPALPGKLTDCVRSDAQYCELFLVEGDSAGGSARQARDRSYQAVMPLRGKILNTWEVEKQDILSSQAICDIAAAMGLQPGCKDLSTLRYYKICILADADSDGLHIATLLCALFVRHFPALVRAGHVHVAMPPLYRIDVGNAIFYALDETEKDRLLKKHDVNKVRVQRFKGLGEMNPAQLRETTMHPQHRRLVQLMIGDEQCLYQVLNKLLAKKYVADRRTWLEQQGDLADDCS